MKFTYGEAETQAIIRYSANLPFQKPWTSQSSHIGIWVMWDSFATADPKNNNRPYPTHMVDF